MNYLIRLLKKILRANIKDFIKFFLPYLIFFNLTIKKDLYMLQL